MTLFVNTDKGMLDISSSVATSIVAGTDISISGATGDVTVNDTSTLSTTTGRGATTANAVTITNATTSSSTTTGALIVTGGVGIGGTVRLGSNVFCSGTYETGTWGATAIGPTFGGTNQITWTTGDMLYASATNTLSKLAAGTNGWVLTMVSGAPAWASAGSVTSASNITGGVAGNVPYQTGASTTAFVTNGAGVIQAATSGATPAWTTTPTLTGTNFSGTAASLSIGGNAATATTASACSGNAATASAVSNTGAVTTNASFFPAFVSSNSTTTEALNTATALTFNPSTGTLSATVLNSTSDRELKKNIRTIINGTEIIESLNGVQFDWKNNDLPSAGLIAQDVEVLMPELVTTNEEGIKALNYNGIIGVLVEALKETNAQVNALRREVAALKSS